MKLRSPLEPSITHYLTLKRALGRQYANEERVLQSIDAFVRLSAPADLTAATFTLWCRTLQHLTPTVKRNRMRIVRNYCLYATFKTIVDDDSFALVCIKRLIGRGYDSELKAFCLRRVSVSKRWGEELQAALDQLNKREAEQKSKG